VYRNTLAKVNFIIPVIPILINLSFAAKDSFCLWAELLWHTDLSEVFGNGFGFPWKCSCRSNHGEFRIESLCSGSEAFPVGKTTTELLVHSGVGTAPHNQAQ
jgi:hypothetical protein